MQRYKSANTSINSAKVPAVFRRLPWSTAAESFNRDTKQYRNVDIGGGKFNTATDYLAKFGVENIIFDPYNREFWHNFRVVADMAINPADSATLSNVLCVIKEREKRIEALERAKRWADVTFITVYEGDKSGVGKPTKKGCWQENRRLEDYLSEVQEVFKHVSIHNRVIIASD